jgi:hypothetical protein
VQGILHSGRFESTVYGKGRLEHPQEKRGHPEHFWNKVFWHGVPYSIRKGRKKYAE